MADSVLDLANQIMSSNTGKGAALGALMSALLKSYSGPGGVNTGVDMSKVGTIAPRTTTIPTGRYVPYSEYGARDVQTPALTPELTRALGLPSNFQLPTASQYTDQPSMMPAAGAAPMTVTSKGTGTGALSMPTLTPRSSTKIDPLIGTLLGAGLGYIMPDTRSSTAAGSTASNAVGNLFNKAISAITGGGRSTTIYDPNYDYTGTTAAGSTPDNPVQYDPKYAYDYKDGGMATPLMANGGAVDSPSYYTFGQVVNPKDIMNQMNQMAQGGLPKQGGLHVPTVEGRHDYRAGSRVTGAGDGQSDDIPAMLADGEYVFDADTVAQLGNGSTKAGSDLLDKFREEIRGHKRSAPLNKIPPPSKSPLAYLAAAQKKTRS